MKKLFIAAALATSIAPLSASANVNDALQNICSIVAADDKSELRRKMRKVQQEYKLKLRDYYTGISCNNQSLIRHAVENGADDVGSLLVSKMRKDELSLPEKDGQTVMQWLNTNGYGQTDTAQRLIDRIG